jgi:hypothetical protein
VCKLDKEIMTLLASIPRNATELPDDIEKELESLLKQRKEHLKTVVIRI